MIRLLALSVINLVRNPLRQAVLYPWVIVTVERWVLQRYHLVIPEIPALQYLGLLAICLGVILFISFLVLVRDHRSLSRNSYTLALVGLGLLAHPALMPS